MRTIQVSLSTIREAMANAAQYSDDWQAECCEILLIPAIAKRWQELNERFTGLRIQRIDGQRYQFTSREDNQSRCDQEQWADVAGYVLVLFTTPAGDYRWNSVKRDYYGHSASTCWNGVGRETLCRFVENLRMLALGHEHADYHRDLAARGIEIVNDLAAVAA